MALPAVLAVELADSELLVDDGLPELVDDGLLEPELLLLLLLAEGELEGSPVVRGFLSLPSAGEISRPLISPPLVA
jgi:hypothetical protein